MVDALTLLPQTTPGLFVLIHCKSLQHFVKTLELFDFIGVLDSSRDVILGYENSISLEKIYLELSLDGNSSLWTPYWREHVFSASKLHGCCFHAFLDWKMYLCVIWWSTKHDWKFSRPCSACSPGLIQIWCGLHQLDLVMQKVFKPAFEDKFYSTLTSLIGSLCCQLNLVAEMLSTCPKVATTQWISRYSITQWFVCHQAWIMQLFVKNGPVIQTTLGRYSCML